jgi:hypothetical protein
MKASEVLYRALTPFGEAGRVLRGDGYVVAYAPLHPIRCIVASSQDVHKALFPEGPPKRRTLEELKEGIRKHAREKHAQLVASVNQRRRKKPAGRL